VFENFEVRHMRLSWPEVVMDNAMTNSIYNRKMKDREDF
jgi:ribosomal protein L31E